MHPILKYILDEAAGTGVAIGIPRQPFAMVKGPRHFRLALGTAHQDIQEWFHAILPEIFLIQQILDQGGGTVMALFMHQPS